MRGQWRRARLGADWYAIEPELIGRLALLVQEMAPLPIQRPYMAALWVPKDPTEPERVIFFSPGWPDPMEALLVGLNPEPCDRPNGDKLTCMFHWGADGADPRITCFGDPGAT